MYKVKHSIQSTLGRTAAKVLKKESKKQWQTQWSIGNTVNEDILYKLTPLIGEVKYVGIYRREENSSRCEMW